MGLSLRYYEMTLMQLLLRCNFNSGYSITPFISKKITCLIMTSLYVGDMAVIINEIGEEGELIQANRA